MRVLDRSPLSDGLVVLTIRTDTGETDTAMWSQVSARKAGECSLTGRAYPASAQVFRPVGNMRYRALRILAEAFNEHPTLR